MKTTVKERLGGSKAAGTMKAVRIHEFGGPEVIRYEDVPRPKEGRGEALIRAYAAGVNPVESKMRQGYRNAPLPMILGYDFSGVVEEVGGGVKKLKPGDEVYGRLDRDRPGAYAEFIVAGENNAAPKPRSLDHVQAAGIPLAALTAWQALFDVGGLSADQTVLIHGAAGGVGHYAVQFAKWKGAHVIASTSGEGVDMVRKLGADEVIDHEAIKFEEAVCCADVVLDVIGGETQERSWKVLREGGILVSTVGIADEGAAARHGVRGVAMVSHPDSGQLATIAGLVDEGKVKPVVSTVLALTEAAKAHEMIESGKTHGKIVLKVRD